MKKGEFIAFLVGIIIALVIGTVIFVDDAIHGRGYNFMSTAEFRQVVSEGKK